MCSIYFIIKPKIFALRNPKTSSHHLKQQLFTWIILQLWTIISPILRPIVDQIILSLRNLKLSPHLLLNKRIRQPYLVKTNDIMV